MDGPVGCQGHERSVQDRGLLGPFIDPKRPDPAFWLLVECRPKGAPQTAPIINTAPIEPFGSQSSH